MKRLLIAGNVALSATPATLNAITSATAIANGALAFYNQESGAIIKDTATVGKPKSVIMMLGDHANGSKTVSFDVANFTYTKAAYVAATKTSATITVPTVTVGKDYTIIVALKGVVLNQRNRYSASIRATTGKSATNIASALADQLTVMGKAHGFKATAAAAVVTVTSLDNETDFAVIGADEMQGAVFTLTPGVIGSGNEDQVKELLRKCRGGEGIQHTDQGGTILYKDPVISGNYVIYTLSFSNARTNESVGSANVKCIVHIAVPNGATCITALDQVLAGLAALHI